MATSLPRRPAIPVSSTTERLVMITLINPGTPTLRISAKSPHCRETPRNAKVTRERRERRAKTAEKQAVEGDHAGNREEVEDIRRREPEQRGQDRPFEQQFGSRRNRAGGGRTGRDGRKE